MLMIGSLFSGIGGLELGLERTGGFKTSWQVEIDPYATKVLEKHWPDVRRFRDIREFAAGSGPHDDLRVDLICGGFPCQPFSTASHGRRIAEDLWPQMFRVVRALAPRMVLAENVSKSAVERAAIDVQSAGYVPRIRRVSAADVGADHIRNRWWLFAHRNDEGKLFPSIDAEMAVLPTVQSNLWGWRSFSCRHGIYNGISCGMDRHRRNRLRCLGNAVVPACAESVGRMILEQAK